MRDKKYYIALDDFERQVVVNCLNEMQNSLIANGKVLYLNLLTSGKLNNIRSRATEAVNNNLIYT